jgi:hypothetical protein
MKLYRKPVPSRAKASANRPATRRCSFDLLRSFLLVICWATLAVSSGVARLG